MAAVEPKRRRCRILSTTISSNWKWVVAVASFWMNFCVHGVLRSSAVVFVALLDNFQLSREDAAWPMGIFGFCMCITGVLSGYLTHYWSSRSIMMVGALAASAAVSLCSYATSIKHVTILYGACQGAGIGLIVPLTHVILNQYFTNYRALAMGIAYSGSSVGSFLFPPLAHWLLGEFGLSGTFILLGGIMLNSLPAVALMRTPPKHGPKGGNTATAVLNNLEPDSKVTMEGGDVKSTKNIPVKPAEELEASGQSSDIRLALNQPVIPLSKCGIVYAYLQRLWTSLNLTVDVLSNPDFLIISTAYAIYFSISAIYLMVILDFADGLGMPKHRGVYLVSAFSFGDLAGRLACGWLADLKCVKRRMIVSCYLITMGGLMMLVPWCHDYAVLTTASVILGVLSGSVVVNFSAMLTESMGLAKLPLAVGFSSFIIGVTAFLRPIVIGFFRDQHQSYNFLFVSTGVVQILATMPLLAKELIGMKWNCKRFNSSSSCGRDTCICQTFCKRKRHPSDG